MVYLHGKYVAELGLILQVRVNPHIFVDTLIASQHHQITTWRTRAMVGKHLMMIISHSCEHAAVVERGWFCINSTTPLARNWTIFTVKTGDGNWSDQIYPNIPKQNPNNGFAPVLRCFIVLDETLDLNMESDLKHLVQATPCPPGISPQKNEETILGAMFIPIPDPAAIRNPQYRTSLGTVSARCKKKHFSCLKVHRWSPLCCSHKDQRPADKNL